VRRTARRIAYGILDRSLRRAFREVRWVGPWDPPPTDRPVVAYANHHAFHDGQLLGWLAERVLRRTTVVWMEDLDRFPFFATLGALPFPSTDPSRRYSTIRQTARLMVRNPDTTLVYFPEGHLHAAEEGITHFAPDVFHRLARVLGDVSFLPIGVHLTGWHDARPTAVLGGGRPHGEPSGREREALQDALLTLRTFPPNSGRLLLDGRRGPHERWDFTWMRRLFLGRGG